MPPANEILAVGQLTPFKVSVLECYVVPAEAQGILLPEHAADAKPGRDTWVRLGKDVDDRDEVRMHYLRHCVQPTILVQNFYGYNG